MKIIHILARAEKGSVNKDTVNSLYSWQTLISSNVVIDLILLFMKTQVYWSKNK